MAFPITPPENMQSKHRPLSVASLIPRQGTPCCQEVPAENHLANTSRSVEPPSLQSRTAEVTSGFESLSLQSGTAEVTSGFTSLSLQSGTAEVTSGFTSLSLQSGTAEVTSGFKSLSLQSGTAEVTSGFESLSLQSGTAEVMDASTQDSSPAQRIKELDQPYDEYMETGPLSLNDAYALIRMAQLLIARQADDEAAMEILKRLAQDPQHDDQELLANICNAISAIERRNRLHNKTLSAEARTLLDKVLYHPYIQKHLSWAT